MLIYRITNKVNDKRYIGQTIQSLQRRFNQHCKGKSVLSSAIRKYGKDNFIVEELAIAKSLEELNGLEKQYIIENNCIAPLGYNLQKGGNTAKATENTKKKLSASIKAMWKDKDYRNKMCESMKSIQHSEHNKNRLRTLFAGHQHSPSSKQKISQKVRGSANANSKLNELDIKFIRHWKSVGGRSKDIYTCFYISKSLFHAIVNKECWRHVE
jgi:group I intron endonuclease